MSHLCLPLQRRFLQLQRHQAKVEGLSLLASVSDPQKFITLVALY